MTPTDDSANSKTWITRKLSQQWVMLTADDADLDAPRVLTNRGEMILVDVHQNVETLEIFHKPCRVEFYQPMR